MSNQSGGSFQLPHSNKREQDAPSTLVPKLRFPEFLEAGEWKEKELAELIFIVTPTKKLQTAQYSDIGLFPIIDQSQSYISGWTDDDGAAIKENLPLIVFGDHTCALKMVDRPFVQGADGIKIFRANSDAFTSYLYQFLQFNPVKMEEYKRHFSILKSKKVFYPDEKSGEQQKIASCLSSLDDLITVENQKLDTLKTHKIGLMQRLFPKVGGASSSPSHSREQDALATLVPELRFQEFRGAEGWIRDKLGNISTIKSGGTPNRANSEYWGGSIPWVTTSLIDSSIIFDVTEYITKAGIENSSAQIFPKSTILMAMYGQGKTRGKVGVLGIDAATNQACAAIILKRKIETGFVFQNLVSRYEEIRKISNSGGQENLSAELIKGISFFFPENCREQQKIASCLSSLDDLIAAHTRKLETLKIHKKGLMQQLFPSVDGVNK
ncbi:MAG: restriction endonuclease subunit S [Zoogloeaceae bacterium]|jgi:type I restriction enzyme S subunit|nr:restriction endonuclease subunit S [Zoogloeaceae bacterium]